MPTPTSAARDRRALRAVAVQFFANGAIFASFAPRLPELRDGLQIDIGTIGLVLSLSSVAGLVGSALVSRAVGRWGTRHVLIAGGALLSLSLVAVGQAPSVAALIVALGVLQICDVMVDVSMNLQGSWLSGRRSTPVMNRLHGMWSLGTLLGGLTTAAVAGAGVSVATHLLIAGVVLLLVVQVVARGLLRTDEGGEAAEAEAPRGTSRVGLSRAMVVLFVVGVLALAIENIPYEWAAFRLRDDLFSGAGVAALGYVAVTVGMTVGRFAGDLIQARLGVRRLRRIALSLLLVGFILATSVGSVGVALVGFTLVGLGNATLLPMLYDQAAKSSGRPGAGLGALTAGMRVSMLLVPLTVGAVAATSLSVGAAIALLAIPALLVFAGVLSFSRVLSAPPSTPPNTPLSDGNRRD